MGIFPANDTQFYVYFCDQGIATDSKIMLNPEEFTEYKWLTPDEAFRHYCDGSMPIFIP